MKAKCVTKFTSEFYDVFTVDKTYDYYEYGEDVIVSSDIFVNSVSVGYRIESNKFNQHFKLLCEFRQEQIDKIL